MAADQLGPDIDSDLALTYGLGGYHESFYSPLWLTDTSPIFVEQSPWTPAPIDISTLQAMQDEPNAPMRTYNLSATLNSPLGGHTMDISQLLVSDSGCTSPAMFNNIKFFPDGFESTTLSWAQGAHTGDQSALQIKGRGSAFFIATDHNQQKHLLIIDNALYVEQHLTTSMLGVRALETAGCRSLEHFKGFACGQTTFMWESHPTGLWHLPYSTIDRGTTITFPVIRINNNTGITFPTIALINKPKIMSSAQSEKYLELHFSYGHMGNAKLFQQLLWPNEPGDERYLHG